MLKKFSLSIFFGLAATAMTAFATPVCSNNVADNGATYFGGGYSCEVGNLLFSNFSYTAAGTNPISANQITVDIVNGSTIGLSFHAPWSAGSNATSDGTIDFEVSVVGGGSLIEDFGLAQTSGVGPTGTASVIERGCGPAYTADCESATGGPIHVITFETGTADQAEADTSFTPSYSSVLVEKDIAVTGNCDFAGISVVEDTFSQLSQCPEPMSLGFIGGGLALLGVVRLRRRAQA
jgi:hypothetical protein